VPLETLGRRGATDAIAWWRLRRWLRSNRPHVVHSWEFPANAYAYAATGDCHHVASVRRRSLNKNWLKDKLEGWLLRRCERVIAECQTVGDAYLLRGGFTTDHRLSVILPGVCPPAKGGSRAALLDELGLPDDVILVTSVGSLTHDARVSDLIWGVEILGALFPLHLLIIGDGPQQRLCERLASALRRTALIHFLGRRDAAEILPHVDMLWYAGAEDRLPAPVLEAMAAGLPVVAPDMPALREAIVPGETGLLFPLGDRPGLARCTQKLLQDRAFAKRLGENARQHVVQQFSVQALVDEYAGLCRSVVAGDSATGRQFQVLK
jgi:glycosyltransferase involved in cell wall biosynthesis